MHLIFLMQFHNMEFLRKPYETRSIPTIKYHNTLYDKLSHGIWVIGSITNIIMLMILVFVLLKIILY